MIHVCFVCLGNICRSPTAEGVFQHLVAAAGLSDAFVIDSAGTAGYHVGEPADHRSAAYARSRGVTLTSRSRRFERGDWARFDVVLAMDRSNLRALERSAGPHRHKLHLMRDFDPDSPPGAEVPDPYYGAGDGFRRVFDICEVACAGLLDSLRREHGL